MKALPVAATARSAPPAARFLRGAAFSALALAGLCGAPAQAQYFWGPPGFDGPEFEYYEYERPSPRRYVVRDVISPRQAASIARAAGYRLVGRPQLRGARIHALGERRDGRRARILINAYSGALLRVTPLAPAQKPAGSRPPPQSPPAAVGGAPSSPPPAPPRQEPAGQGPAGQAPSGGPGAVAPGAPASPPAQPQPPASQSVPAPTQAPSAQPAPPAAPADIGPSVRPVNPAQNPAAPAPAPKPPVDSAPAPAEAPKAQPPAGAPDTPRPAPEAPKNPT